MHLKSGMLKWFRGKEAVLHYASLGKARYLGDLVDSV